MLTKITELGKNLTEVEVARFERAHDIWLPHSYKAFLLRNNGGRPLEAAFPIDGLANNPYGGIQVFFSLGSGIEVLELNAILNDLKTAIPAGIVPIACTDGYDFVCLDLRRPGGPVVFWDRRPFWGSGVWSEADLYPIAPNFASLLQVLWDDAEA